MMPQGMIALVSRVISPSPRMIPEKSEMAGLKPLVLGKPFSCVHWRVRKTTAAIQGSMYSSVRFPSSKEQRSQSRETAVRRHACKGFLNNRNPLRMKNRVTAR